MHEHLNRGVVFKTSEETIPNTLPLKTHKDRLGLKRKQGEEKIPHPALLLLKQESNGAYLQPPTNSTFWFSLEILS